MKHKHNFKQLAVTLAVLLIALLVSQYDNYDYNKHMQYARMNNCTWDYSDYNWGLCK